MGAGVRCRVRRIAAVAVVGWLSLAAPLSARASADDGPYLGRRVVDVLAQMQKDKRIIFSSSLVPPSLLVKAEPKGRTKREVVVEILAQHGLSLKDGPGGIWLVIIKPPAPTTPAQPPPKSPSRTPLPPSPRTGDGVPEADGDPQSLPHVEEHVNVTGRSGEFERQPAVKSLPAAAVTQTAGGLENVFQVLPLLPGVAATGDDLGKVAVRGAGPQHNVVVFDGVQVHSPQRLGDFTSSFINPAVTASVALDASGLDARYGGRLSSVLVIETRDGRTDRRLAFSGSVGLTNGDVLVEGRVPGTTSGSWWVTARGTYYRFVAERFRDGTIPNFSDVQFKIALRPTTHTRLSLVGLAGKEGMVRPLLGLPEPQLLPGNIQRESSASNLLTSANLSWTPSERLTTVTTLTSYSNASRYQDHWNFGNAQPANSGPVGPFDRSVRVVDLAVRQRAMFVWSPGHVLDIGGDVRRLRNAWAMSGATYAPWSGSVAPNTWGELIDYSDGPIDIRLARTQVGAWLQERIPIGAGFEVEPALRMDWNSFTGERALQPRLRVTKRFADTVVWGGLAWQAQTPGHETMQQGFQFFDITSPEADLRNERSRQIVLGMERTMAHAITLRVEAYRRTFDRLLVQRPETENERQQRLSTYAIPPDLPPDSGLLEYRPTVHPQSVGTGRAAGVEVLVQRNRGRLTGWLAYTLSNAERELYGRTVPFDFDRRHALGTVSHVQLSPTIRVSTTVQFASGFPATPPRREVSFRRRLLPDRSLDPLLHPARQTNGTFVTDHVGYPYRVSLLNSERMRAYGRTDVRVTWSPSQNWEFYGEVLNLFNRSNYSQPVGTELPGSLSYGELQTFAGHPRLPTYGVRVTF